MVWPVSKNKTSIRKIISRSRFEKLKILMIDINENEDIADKFQIKSVPTFYLYKEKLFKGSTSGADINKIKGLLKSMNN